MNNAEIFQYLGWVGTLILVIGFYSVLVSTNLIRTLIGVEILTKSVTLLIILAGFMTGQMGLAQALAITLIIIEVALTAVAVGIVLCLYKRNKSLDAKTVQEIKG